MWIVTDCFSRNALELLCIWWNLIYLILNANWFLQRVIFQFIQDSVSRVTYCTNAYVVAV